MLPLLEENANKLGKTEEEARWNFFPLGAERKEKYSFCLAKKGKAGDGKTGMNLKKEQQGKNLLYSICGKFKGVCTFFRWKTKLAFLVGYCYIPGERELPL